MNRIEEIELKGRIVIAAYRPREGKSAELLALLAEHVPLLRSLRLATDRPVSVMRSTDGTFLEVFEWSSPDAIDRAHSEPAVLDLWERFGQAADYCQLASLSEATQMFAEFEPVDLSH